MNSIVDTHCHLDLEAFDADRADVLRRALDSGVHAMVLVGYNPDRWRSTQQLCNDHPFLLRTVGVHPNDAEIWNDDTCQALRDELSMSRPVAIGEIGLDFYRSSDNADQQKRAFVAQLGIAEEFNLPVVIHQRAAEEQVLDVLSDVRPSAGVMHCFTGDRDYAERCLELGLSLGVGGVATFPRSHEIRDALADVPLDLLLLETDSPFLAPQVRRGKRNEPSLLPSVIRGLASWKDVPDAEIAERTTRNAVALFGDELLHAISRGMESR